MACLLTSFKPQTSSQKPKQREALFLHVMDEGIPLEAGVTPKHLSVPAEAIIFLPLFHPPAQQCTPALSLGQHRDTPGGRGSCRCIQPSTESAANGSY